MASHNVYGKVGLVLGIAASVLLLAGDSSGLQMSGLQNIKITLIPVKPISGDNISLKAELTYPTAGYAVELHLGQLTSGINLTKLILPMVMTLYSEELDRMEKKTPEQMLKVELEKEFGFSPIVARALLNKIDSYNASNKSN